MKRIFCYFKFYDEKGRQKAELSCLFDLSDNAFMSPTLNNDLEEKALKMKINYKRVLLINLSVLGEVK